MHANAACGRGVLALAIIFAALSAYADEDGAFCVSEGYLAYEIRSGLTSGVNGHAVKVVKFGPEQGIYAAGEVTLQDFQVHEMTCDKNRIKIAGWGMGFQQYVLEISGPQNMHVVEHVEDSTRKFDPSKQGPEP